MRALLFSLTLLVTSHLFASGTERNNESSQQPHREDIRPNNLTINVLPIEETIELAQNQQNQLRTLAAQSIIDLAQNRHWWFRFWDKTSKVSEALTKLGYISTTGYGAYAAAKDSDGTSIGVQYVDGIIIATLYAGTKGMERFTRYCAKESKQRLDTYNSLVAPYGAPTININPEDDVNSDLGSQTDTRVNAVIEALTPGSMQRQHDGSQLDNNRSHTPPQVSVAHDDDDSLSREADDNN